MAAVLIDGKKLAGEYLVRLKEQIKAQALRPSLTIILVGQDPASVTYVNQKKKRGEEIGIKVEVVALPEAVSEEQVASLIKKYNQDHSTDGIILQLPLAAHLNPKRLCNQITSHKDVDGLGTKPLFQSATARAILYLIEQTGIKPLGQKAVMIGASALVGIPTAQLLSDLGAQVTIVDINTKEPQRVSRAADILVVAIGDPEFVKASWVKKGAVVIDVGINRTPKGLVGDVDYGEVSQKAGFITPVPGGVGPMTVAMLLQNVTEAAQQKQQARLQS